MNNIKKIAALCLFLLLSAALHAQAGGSSSGLDQTMRSSGRIYVVIAVILVILAGLILYVVRVDRKVSKLERGQ